MAAGLALAVPPHTTPGLQRVSCRSCHQVHHTLCWLQRGHTAPLLLLLLLKLFSVHCCYYVVLLLLLLDHLH
jgi:hypothetical protein